ncbi:hypothetical protein X975_10803, partial [Stegodyphus mimosarum]
MAKVFIPNSSNGTKVYDDEVPLHQYVDLKNESHPELWQLLSNDAFPKNEIFNNTPENEDSGEKDYYTTDQKVSQIAFCFKEGEPSHFNPFFVNENSEDSSKKYCPDTSNEKFSIEPDHSLTTSKRYLIFSNHQTDIDNSSEYELSNLLSSCCKFQEHDYLKTESFKCSIVLTDPLECTDDKYYTPDLLSSKRCSGEKVCDDNFEQTVVSLIPNNILTDEPQNEFGCENYQEKSLGSDTINICNSDEETGSALVGLVSNYSENSSASEFNCKNKSENSYGAFSNTGDIVSLVDLANTFLENASSPEFSYDINNEISCHNTSETIFNLEDQIGDLTNDFHVVASLNAKTCKIDEEKSLDDTANAILNSDETNISLFGLASTYPKNISSAELSCKSNSETSFDAISRDILPPGNNISLADLADTFLKNTSSPGYNRESNKEIICHNTSNNILHLDEASSLAAIANDFLVNPSLNMVNCKTDRENPLDVIPKYMFNFEGEIDVSLADLTSSLLENVSSSELSCKSVLSSEATSGAISDVKVTENEIDKFLKGLDNFDSSDVLDKIKSVENEEEYDYFLTHKEKSETQLSPECFETESKGARCTPEVNLTECIKKQDTSVYEPKPGIYPEAKLSISGCFETERKSEYSPEVNLNYRFKKEDSGNHHTNKACIYRKPNDIIANTLSAGSCIDFLLPQRSTLGYKLVGPQAQSNKYLVGKRESSQKNDIRKKQSLFAKALTCKTKKS